MGSVDSLVTAKITKVTQNFGYELCLYINGPCLTTAPGEHAFLTS